MNRALQFGAVAILCAAAVTAQARDRIRIVGSSTVFPYTQRVAEEFAKAGTFPTPDVSSTGTGGGMALFCRGRGPRHPDITGASRRMTRAEWEDCRRSGIHHISELLIGLDGLTLATSKNASAFQLTLRDVYTALAARVPVNGAIVPNPHERWSDIRPELPATAIVVIGPPKTSGTRDAFVELAMQRGCATYPELTALRARDPAEWTDICGRMRTDGAYVEAGEKDDEIVARVKRNPNEIGIFGYSYFHESEADLTAVAIEGVTPDVHTIQSGDYPLARPLYIYIKNDNRDLVPGITEFIEAFRQGSADGGYLFGLGLVPLADDDRDFVLTGALTGEPMMRPQD